MPPLAGLTGYQRLGLVTILGLLGLVVLGGIVRVTNSGLACPDWPLCYGELFPGGPYLSEGETLRGYQVYLEWTHRLVASVMGLAILAFVVGAWQRHRDRRWVVLPASLALVALAIQVVLGGLTVTEDLDAGVVAAHLSVALIIILLICGAWLATFARVSAPTGRPSHKPTSPAGATPQLARWALASLIGLLALMVLGGYVSGTEAAFYCNAEWPLCNGALFPEGRNAGIQMSHRFVAAVVGLIVLGFWFAARRERASQPGASQLASLLLVLFIAQALLGAATQWTTLADWSRVVHLTAGTLTWVTAVLLVGLLVYRAAWFPSMWRRMALPAFFPDRLSVRESQPGD